LEVHRHIAVALMPNWREPLRAKQELHFRICWATTIFWI
jgi:hypothetical protein